MISYYSDPDLDKCEQVPNLLDGSNDAMRHMLNIFSAVCLVIHIVFVGYAVYVSVSLCKKKMTFATKLILVTLFSSIFLIDELLVCFFLTTIDEKL